MVDGEGRNPQRAPTIYDALIVVWLAILVLAYWWLRIIKPATIPFHVLANQDFFTQIYPMSFRAAAWLRNGTVPLWNPFQYCGVPFLATGIYGVLYPFNFPYLILPTAKAIEVVVLMHLIAAGAFMYAYARVIHLGRLAATLGAVTFMLSGFLTSQAAWFPPAIACAAWLPLALTAVERIFERRRFSWAILLGLATTMPALSGWPQTWVYTMYVVGGYAACRLLLLLRRPAHREQAGRIALLLAAGVLLGVLLPAAQLLPSFELQSLGPRRPGGLSMEQALVLGPMTPDALVQEALDSYPGQPRLPYVGMATLLLIPLALFARRGVLRVLFLLAVAVLSLCVTLTIFTPVFHFYRLLLPGGTWFRAPPRILFIYAFTTAGLGAIGMNVVASGRAVFRQRTWIVPMVGSGIGLGLQLVAMPPLSRAYLAVGMGLLWCTALIRRQRLRAWLSSALLVLVTCDLFFAMRNPYEHPYTDPTVFDREAAAFAFIKEHQGFDRTYIHAEIAGPDVMAKQGTLREIYSVTDYEPLSLSRYDKFFNLIEPEEWHRPVLMTFTGALRANPERRGFRLLDLLSVRYVMVHAGAQEYRGALERAALKPVFQSPGFGMGVYENPWAMPRAYVVHGVLPVRSDDEALSTVGHIDARKTVVLEGLHDTPSPADILGTNRMTTAKFIAYQPDDVVLQTDDPAPGYLVLTDTFYPGWKAFVDDQPTTIYPANYIVRAVQVPAGRHMVRFVYKPLSFTIGALLSLAGLACMAIYGCVRIYRRH